MNDIELCDKCGAWCRGGRCCKQSDFVPYSEEELKAQRGRYFSESDVDDVVKTALHLYAENARLRKALEFYASEDNYDSDGPDYDSTAQADCGERAREALDTA